MKKERKHKIAKCLAKTEHLPNPTCACWAYYKSLPPEMARDFAKLVQEVAKQKEPIR